MGIAPSNHSSSQKTSLNDLSHGINIWTDFSSVLSQSMHLTDGQTDRQTEFSSVDHICIPCSAVKIQLSSQDLLSSSARSTRLPVNSCCRRCLSSPILSRTSLIFRSNLLAVACNQTASQSIYSVSQKKVAPLKLFAIFSLRLCIFPWNFASMLPVYIYTYLPILVDLS